MGLSGSEERPGRPDTSSALTPVPGTSALGHLEVIDHAEADRIAGTVLSLRDRWTVRSPREAFFTLGLNAYMDLTPSPEPQATYFGPAEPANQLLREHFADLYGVLATRLGDAVGLPARYSHDLPLPGFHIWTADGIPRSASSSLHFDLQYERIRRREAYAGASGTVSFTLPLRLPAEGSSLLVWPAVTYPAAEGALDRARTMPPLVVEYRVGRALVHSGHVLHQIGPTHDVAPTDLRLTLQGHALVVADELILYW